MNKYITIAPLTYRWEETIKKSRFILNICRIESESDAHNFINQITKQHHKANHNVFAYVLGEKSEIQRYSDNGEPSGTAGVPMLEVIQKNELRNVVAVITRYFGGIKLGAGGLIRAYASTTAKGIEQAGLVNRLLQQKITITIDYKYADSLIYWLTVNKYTLSEISYDTAVHIIVPIEKDKVTDVRATLTDRFSNQLTFIIGDETFFEIPLK